MGNKASFFAGAATTLALSATALALAAPGHIIHEKGGGEVVITAPQAACFADCAISAGVWDGDRTDMIRACAWRDGEGGYKALTLGLTTSAPADVPIGARKFGYVE